MAESRVHYEVKLWVPEKVVGAGDREDVTFPCHLSPETSAVAMTIRWFKRTECIYLYKNGQVIEARGYEGRASLVTQELERGDVSLRLREYGASDRGEYFCQVIHGKQIKEEAIVGLWHKDSVHSVDILNRVEGYLQSPADKLEREESAYLLENQMYNKIIEERDKLLEDRLKSEQDLESESYQRKEFEKNVASFNERTRSLEEREKLLEDTNKKIEEKDGRVKDAIKTLSTLKKRIEEKDSLLEESFKQQEDTERRLKKASTELEEKTQHLQEKETQLEDVKHENTQLVQQICDLKTEIARQRKESNQTSVGGKTLYTHARQPIKRRNSMWEPPAMGEESSSVRLVLLGGTMAERKAAGDTILGREEFEAQASPAADIHSCMRREGDVCGRRLVLVDIPDLFFAGLSLEEMRQRVALGVRLSAPGPHAFLLVNPMESSEEEERRAMGKMAEIFGEDCWGHTIVLFTHDDNWREESMKEFVLKGGQDLQRLLDKCEHRHHVLNIKDRGHESQVSELLDQVKEIVAGNSFYSSQNYLEAEAQVRDIEENIQKKRKEKMRRDETEMTSNFATRLQNYLKKMDGVIQKQEEDIQTLSHQTTQLESRIKEERNEETKRELERKLIRESGQREEMKRKLERLREEKEKERREREERHGQHMEKIRENYEGETRVEAETNLMEVVLPELQRSIMASRTKMQRMFNRQIEDKDRQIEDRDRETERLRNKLKDLSEDFLREVYAVKEGGKKIPSHI